jgi:hypothetical protein
MGLAAAERPMHYANMTKTSRLALLVTVAAALAGCTATISETGPMGPPGAAGPAGPQGPANMAPQRLAMVRATADLTVPGDVDVVVADTAKIVVRLPSARDAGSGRVITVRANADDVRAGTTGNDLIDTVRFMEFEAGEMATFISDGESRWVVISASDL